MSGTQAPLLLLHGLLMNANAWGPLHGLLSRFAMVSAPNLPGHGGCPDEPELIDASALADRLALDLAPGTDLVGWSFGGQLALHIAARHPGRVRRLVLIATPLCFASRADWAHGVSLSRCDEFCTEIAREPKAAMDRFAHFQVHGCASARLLLRQLKARLALLPAPDPAALARELRWLIEADLRGLARELGVPTLLVSGVHDPLVPRAASEALCASLKNATHVSLEACGHAPFLAHPELVARHIKAHLCAGQAA